jgi:aminoglycoside phosphotransferase family enzyme
MTELIDFLQNTKSYPENTKEIIFVQTHISWVFIGNEYVYKVKKPVNLGFLDFTTLKKRKFYVNEELRLNARFSPSIYLEMVPISQKGDSFVLGDDSNIVEYALKMKRISEDQMLYKLLLAGKISAAEMQRIGAHLAAVYGTFESNDKARSFGTLDTISFNVKENFDQTRKYIGGPVSEEKFAAIEGWSLKFMEDNQALFERRMANGCIKECHGDLHLQHICIKDDDIFVFDCIEFNERMRYGDVAADVAFLSMDLDYNGRSDLAEAFVKAYVEASGDEDLLNILIFYKVYRAYVRAKVTSFMLNDEGISKERYAKATRSAAEYYDLAYGYVRA